MRVQTRSTVGENKAPVEFAGANPAAESLLDYYRSVDAGATKWVVGQAAERVCARIQPLILSSALRLIGRRTGLRGYAAAQAAEDISQMVLANLLTRVKTGSPVRRFDPAKRDLGAFVWVLVDRAIISDICRRRLPISFSSMNLPSGELMCIRCGSPSGEMELRDQPEELRLAINLLPGITCQVMGRVYLDGEGKKKVAKSLNRSPSFVTREIAKGLILLKAILGHLRQTGKWPPVISGEVSSGLLEA